MSSLYAIFLEYFIFICLMVIYVTILELIALNNRSASNSGPSSLYGPDSTASSNNGNYRKVFKPSFGDDGGNSEKSFGSSSAINNTYQAGSKPLSRPPVNSRLKPKLPQKSYGK